MIEKAMAAVGTFPLRAQQRMQIVKAEHGQHEVLCRVFECPKGVSENEIARVWAQVCVRHPLTRAYISDDGARLVVGDADPYIECLNDQGLETGQELRNSFYDLPPGRFGIKTSRANGRVVVCVGGSHVITDGGGISRLSSELGLSLGKASVSGVGDELATYGQLVDTELNVLAKPSDASRKYWSGRNDVMRTEGPLPRSVRTSSPCALFTFSLDLEEAQRIMNCCLRKRGPASAHFLLAFNVAMSRLLDVDTVPIRMFDSRRHSRATGYVIGNIGDDLMFASDPIGDTPPERALTQAVATLQDAMSHSLSFRAFDPADVPATDFVFELVNGTSQGGRVKHMPRSFHLTSINHLAGLRVVQTDYGFDISVILNATAFSQGEMILTARHLKKLLKV